MGKKLLKFFAVCAISVITAMGFTACSGSVKLLEENIIDDNYDNYYEIFVYSFYDSDGDGYGDLNGVTQKLDYIRDLGYTGIWLMPIMPTPSYHGYDVTDYCAINQLYGTMDDYENLLKEAHQRGIKVIIDLVVNHTSSQHPWFTQAVDAIKKGNLSNPYSTYYNFKTTQDAGYKAVAGTNNWFYEAQFDSSMPDLNLDSAAVRGEIENIMKFWLEKGTDGFRLDACLYFYSADGGVASSVEFCRWLKETASKYNEDAYLVGECWSSASTIQAYYGSGMDSFFCFPASAAATPGWVASCVSTQSASAFWSSIGKVNTMAGEYIPAPFLGNHDTGRIAGVMGRKSDNIKFAYGLLCMYNGNVFTYYGDEIGMVGGVNCDQDKRIGMLWDNKKTNMTNAPVGTTIQEYIFDGVAEQLKDSSSILNYYKVCNNARNAFPALMRGTPSKITYDDPAILVFTKTWQDETITLVINFADEKKTVTGIEGTLAQGICVSGSIKQSGTSLTMPKYSIAILT